MEIGDTVKLRGQNAFGTTTIECEVIDREDAVKISPDDPFPAEGKDWILRGPHCNIYQLPEGEDETREGCKVVD